MGLFSGLFGGGSKNQFQGDTYTTSQGLPRPIRGTTWLDGQKQSTADITKSGYNLEMFMDPETRAVYDQGKSGTASLLPQLQGLADVSDGKRESYINALYEPQARSLRKEHGFITGQAKGAAGARGMRNSVGFENYRANQLDDSLMKNLGDLRAQAEISSYDMPNILMQPLANALGLYSAAGNDALQRTLRMADPSVQGFTDATNFAISRSSGNQAAQAQNKPSSGGFLQGLLSRLF